MYVVAFNASPRKANTYSAIQTVLGRLEGCGIETKLIQLGGNLVSGCRDCCWCVRQKTDRCAIGNDMINDCIAEMIKADGIIIGSPVYFGNVTPEAAALIGRAGRVCKRGGFLLKRKVGAAVVSARRAGSNFTYSAINFFFGNNQMITPHSSYWNMTLADGAGDYERDTEGIGTFETLGDNMAWLLEKLAK